MKAVAMPRWSQAIREAGNVVLPFAFKFGGAREKPTLYLTDSRMHGFATLPTSARSRSRRRDWLTPLAVLAEHATLGHMLVAFDIDGAPRYEYPALESMSTTSRRWPCALRNGISACRGMTVGVELGGAIVLGAIHVPTDPECECSSTISDRRRRFRPTDFRRCLKVPSPPAVFRDRIVLLGANALGTRDTFVSPFTAVMPGVERLATVVDSILHERNLYRPDAARGSRRRSCSSPRWHWDLPYRDTRSQWGPFAPSCSWRSC